MIRGVPASAGVNVPALGSTGDFTPWHGTSKDPKYLISDQQWVACANDRTATFVSAFAGTGIPLIWNFRDAIENGRALDSIDSLAGGPRPCVAIFYRLRGVT